MANNLCNEFPIWGLVPKKETGVVNFLTKYPEFDGRELVIAILDSGVDPAAAGLDITSEGLPKVIERFDCSGAGDVDTSTIIKPTNGTIRGLSGRTLHIPSSWRNPTNEYHIGIKNAYDLYPEKLKERISNDSKESLWDPPHQYCLAEISRKLLNFDVKHAGSTPLTNEQKLEKEDLEARLECLNAYEKKYKDVGPSYDCIVFHDGDNWQACINTSCTGNLSDLPLIGEYSKTRDHQFLTKEDQFTISINVHANGNLLEIVGLSSSHGTHVASITAAYFPDCPAKNGVAPGAQIVSLTIGDARLQGMETGTGLIRAMIKIMELSEKMPIHVVNMSYGEHAHWSSAGRLGSLMNEVVNKYGIVWVASAGNHGPALCTVGAPPDISQPTIIGVGAYVSPDMMIAEYSLRQKLPGMPYTWSSRGPTIDGHNGVSICAPGGAITSVPMFTLRSSQLMNGTSMSAPHVAGAVGLLLSGLKQKGFKFSPYSVKRALENSAQVLQDVESFAQGYGLLQVDRAFELLVAYHKCIARDVRLDVNVNGTRNKGIHVRSAVIANRTLDFAVTVTPHFLKHPLTEQSCKTSFAVTLALTCDADYVECPSFLELANMGRVVSVRIDPTGLKPDAAYATTINGYDINCPEKGPLLRIPITVVRPLVLPDPVYQPKLHWDNVHFVPNTIRRHFIVVPIDATWAVLRFNALDSEKLARFMIHTMQIYPKKSCKMHESQRFWSLGPLTDSEHAFAVVGGLVLEVCIAKFWASIDNVNLSYSINFHGVQPVNAKVMMHGAEGIHNMYVRTLRNEEVAPVVTLHYSVTPIRPTESKVNPLTVRDVILPERQLYELVLTYNFHVAKQTEVMPNCHTISDMLYESEFDSQIWCLYDSSKQLIAVGDAYPKKYATKVDKGEYTLKLQIRHEKRDLLEKYTDLSVFISQRLPTPLTLDVYGSKNNALLHEKKVATLSCLPGTLLPLYIATLPSDKIPKTSVYGHYLSGHIVLTKDEAGKKVCQYSFKYILSEAPKKPVSPTTLKTDKDKSKYDEYIDALKELRLSWLVKLEGCNEAFRLYSEIQDQHRDCVAIHTAMLQSLEPADVQQQIPKTPVAVEGCAEQLLKIEAIANVVIDQIDQDQLLAFYGLKIDLRPDASKIKTEMDRQRTALIEALARKGVVACKHYVAACDADKPKKLDEVTNIWHNILKFTDQNDTKVLFFGMWHAAIHNHMGRLLKFMQKFGDEKPSRALDLKIISVLEALEWNHCGRYLECAIPMKFPCGYTPF